MTIYFIQTLDPQDLAGRFSTESVLEPLRGPDAEWKQDHLEKIKEVIDRLPDREADLVRLYYFKQKRQTDIAEIFNITQAAVSYRLKRALSRIKFLVSLPDATKQDIYREMLHVLPTKLDAQIFAEMYETTCQSEVSRVLEISQGRVRHRYISNLAKMGDVLVDRLFAWAKRNGGLAEIGAVVEGVEKYREKRDKGEEATVLEETIGGLIEMTESLGCEDERLLDFMSYYKTFVTIRYNFNILREIKLPKWSNRPSYTIS